MAVQSVKETNIDLIWFFMYANHYKAHVINTKTSHNYSIISNGNLKIYHITSNGTLYCQHRGKIYATYSVTTTKKWIKAKRTLKNNNKKTNSRSRLKEEKNKIITKLVRFWFCNFVYSFVYVVIIIIIINILN